jgi:hypothetical protein
VAGGGTRLWKAYQDLASFWGQVVLQPKYQDQVYGPEREVPDHAEGVELRQCLPDRSANVTLTGFFFTMQGDQQAVDIHWLSRLAAGALFLGAGAIAWLCRRPGGPRPDIIALGLIAALDLDYLLPIRIGYTDLLFLLPIALMMRSLFPGPSVGPAAGFLLVGLAVGHWSIELRDAPIVIPYLTNCFRSLVVVGVLNVLAIGTVWRARRRRVLRPA